MSFVYELWIKIKIRFCLKFWYILHFKLKKWMNSHFNPITLTFFDVLNASLSRYWIENVSNVIKKSNTNIKHQHLKKVNVIRLKRLYSFIYLVQGPKCIEVSDEDKF